MSTIAAAPSAGSHSATASAEFNQLERAVVQDSITRKLRRITQDEQLRRELLWLRAQEKEDAESVASLERADPRLRARMEPLLFATRPDLMDDPRDRRKEFARLWDQHFERA